MSDRAGFGSPPEAHPKDLVVFVHGFGSSAECWSTLRGFLETDRELTERFEFAYFDYPTEWFNHRPWTEIPRLAVISQLLDGFLQVQKSRGRELTLVGHSQGGLVILAHIAGKLRESKRDEIRNVRQVILLATPNLGSEFLSPLRKVMSMFFFNPQEQTLRVHNPEIKDILTVVRQRVIAAEPEDPGGLPIPVLAFHASQDGIVTEASAHGPFDNVGSLPGDHFTVLQPENANDDPRYRRLKDALLCPVGHGNVFEVEEYETSIRVKPLDGVQTIRVSYGGNSRIVETDNTGSVLRRVRISPSNRCHSVFCIRYATRKDGYVKQTYDGSENDAPATDVDRWADTGRECTFGFRPGTDSGLWYAQDVEVLKGFDAENRHVHFHLGGHSYYKRLLYTLDLTAYVHAGHLVSTQPELFLHHLERKHDEMCDQRRLGISIRPILAEAKGFWQWELRRVREGVVDMVWDAKEPR